MNDDQKILDSHRLEMEAGGQALQGGNRDQAGVRFYDALEMLDDLGSDKARRDALGPFALSMQRAPYRDRDVHMPTPLAVGEEFIQALRHIHFRQGEFGPHLTPAERYLSIQGEYGNSPRLIDQVSLHRV